MKKITRRNFLQVSGFCTMAAALSACTGSGTAASAASSGAASAASASAASAAGSGDYKDELHIAFSDVPDTLDCVNTSSDSCGGIMCGTVFDTLVALCTDYSVKPELCESWEVSTDATKYTYALRQGVKFHNGAEMKASDVAASMNRWVQNFGTATTYIGANNAFEAVDDYTLQIQMDHPYLYLNELIATAAQKPIITPASSLDKLDAATGNLTEFIGTGPYEFGEWAPDQYIKLTAWKDYVPYFQESESDGWYGYKSAATPTVYYDIATDDATRLAGLQSGEYDIALGLSPDNYDLLANDSNFATYTELDGDMIMIYNKREGVASDATFRRAVNAALNCSDISLFAFGNDAFFDLESSYMCVPENDFYSKEGEAEYNQNSPDKAKELLTQCGYSGEPFRLLVASSETDFYNAAVTIQQELQAAGIDCELVTTDWATYLNYSPDQTKYDAFITSFSVKQVPPLILYLSATWNGWAEDQKLQDGLTSINQSADRTAAVATWNELQRYCWEEYMPVSKLCNKYVYAATSAKVKNMVFFKDAHAWNVVVEK